MHVNKFVDDKRVSGRLWNLTRCVFHDVCVHAQTWPKLDDECMSGRAHASESSQANLYAVQSSNTKITQFTHKPRLQGERDQGG